MPRFEQNVHMRFSTAFINHPVFISHWISLSFLSENWKILISDSIKFELRRYMYKKETLIIAGIYRESDRVGISIYVDYVFGVLDGVF